MQNATLPLFRRIGTFIAEFVTYVNEPQTAFGLWIAATGIIVGAYLVSPFRL